MTILSQIFDTQTLVELLSYYPPDNDYWLNLAFPRTLNFTQQFIDFEKIVHYKKIAPLSIPMNQGKPIFHLQSTLTRITPAFLKMKDPVVATQMLTRQPGNMDFGSLAGPTPLQNYQYTVMEIIRQHKDAIQRRWGLMAARAVMDGKILLEGPDYAARLIDFGRDANQTVVLAAGATWGSAGVDIIQDIENWRATMRNKPFAGATTRITMGNSAWQIFRNDANVYKTLNVLTRGTTSDVKVTEPLGGYVVEYGGRLGDIEVYIYNDFYQDDVGNNISIMNPFDVILTGPAIQGVRAFGAIPDKQAQFAALPIFPKLWDEEDPAATFIMSQSAPLMIPVNPNASFKATVG